MKDADDSFEKQDNDLEKVYQRFSSGRMKAFGEQFYIF